MSGGLSVPLAFVALVVGGSAKTWFAIGAFIALWVFALGMAKKNYQLLSQRKPTPLVVAPLPAKKLSQGGSLKYEIQVAVSNENQSVNGVKVKLVKVDPPFASKSGDYDFSNADNLQLLDGSHMNRNEIIRLRLFTVYHSPPDGFKLDCKSGVAGLRACNPAHQLTFETSAVGLDTHITLLTMNFSSDPNKPAATLV